MLCGHDVTENGCSMADGAVTADDWRLAPHSWPALRSDAFTRAAVTGYGAKRVCAVGKRLLLRSYTDIDKIYSIMQTTSGAGMMIL